MQIIVVQTCLYTAGRSSHPNLKDGGALQICVKRFQIDYYPYHMAKATRKHWPKYNSTVPHVMWQDQAYASFKSKFMDLIDKNKSQHTPLSRTSKDSSPNLNVDKKQSISSPNQKDLKKRIENLLTKLMMTCVIVRIEDFTLYKVTTSGKKQALKEFVAGEYFVN